MTSYKICEEIGSGTFGRLYSAVNQNTGELIAIKTEYKGSDIPMLLHEASMYRQLHQKKDEPIGIPKIYQCSCNSDYYLLEMELLGLSLEELFRKCKRKFSLKTVLMLADQMLSRLEYIHDQGLLHRDIKPENFVMGKGKNENTVYIIDLGLAKPYMNDGKHAACKKGKRLVGTAKYVSINTHKGISQSRRDGMESLAYVWIYFLKGLPWEDCKGKDKWERYESIKEKKIKTSIADLCRGLPEEFSQYLKEVRGLKFDERPDYQKYKLMFKALFERQGFQEDYEYDWKVKQDDTSCGLAVSKARAFRISDLNASFQLGNAKENEIITKLASECKISSLLLKSNQVATKTTKSKACAPFLACFF